VRRRGRRAGSGQKGRAARRGVNTISGSRFNAAGAMRARRGARMGAPRGSSSRAGQGPAFQRPQVARTAPCGYRRRLPFGRAAPPDPELGFATSRLTPSGLAFQRRGVFAVARGPGGGGRRPSERVLALAIHGDSSDPPLRMGSMICSATWRGRRDHRASDVPLGPPGMSSPTRTR